jgi:hypothetical protein
MQIKMKPETIARRAAERAIENATRYHRHTLRLAELVERDGPDSLWPELLAEHLARLPAGVM